MLVLGGVSSDLADGRARARRALVSGKGLAKLRQMVAAQGGSPDTLDDPESLFRQCDRIPIAVDRRGVVVALEARRVGAAIRDLQALAGEERHACGLLLARKVGDEVSADAVAFLLVPRAAHGAAQDVAARIRAAYQIGDRPPPALQVVADTITS